MEHIPRIHLTLDWTDDRYRRIVSVIGLQGYRRARNFVERAGRDRHVTRIALYLSAHDAVELLIGGVLAESQIPASGGMVMHRSDSTVAEMRRFLWKQIATLFGPFTHHLIYDERAEDDYGRRKELTWDLPREFVIPWLVWRAYMDRRTPNPWGTPIKGPIGDCG